MSNEKKDLNLSKPPASGGCHIHHEPPTPETPQTLTAQREEGKKREK